MSSSPNVIVVGGGPAGLMAAEVARSRGLSVALYDRMGSVGRKILIAGKGGLNLTHSEPPQRFRQRYTAGQPQVSQWLDVFDADALRRWAAGLGIETMVGSSGRVFPADFKAAPLLRGWVKRLKQQGVTFQVGQRWLGWDGAGGLVFDGADGRVVQSSGATVLALGGSSWSKLGSDGRWAQTLAAEQVAVEPFGPSNGGFELAWSPIFRERFAGQPLKSVAVGVATGGALGDLGQVQRGEFVITDYGVEGGVIYALSAQIRSILQRGFQPTLSIDLFPERGAGQLEQRLLRPRGRRSFSEHLRRSLGLTGLRAGLLRETCPDAGQWPAARLAASLKALPLVVQAARPIDEAISTSGGIALDQVNDALMLKRLPGVFCAGEMLAWDAPTGGYLLTACLASGLVAGHGAADWLESST